jgi:exosortase/archaeosortase family protein
MKNRFEGAMKRNVEAEVPNRRWTPTVRFAVAFGLLSAVLLGLYYFPHADHTEKAIDGYLRLYARIVGALLRLFEPSVRVVDRMIVGRFSLQIVKTCDAMDVTILLVSAIVAWPGPPRRKIGAVIVGTATLLVTNVVRLFSLYYVGLFAPSSFDIMHLEIWPVFILIVGIGFFWLYVGSPKVSSQ